MVHEIFDKKTGSGALATRKGGISVNEHLTEELHKLVIKTFKTGNVYARFIDNIWTADSAEIKSLPSKNKNVKYLLCVIDIFTNELNL